MNITFSVIELKKRLAQLGSVVARKSEEALYRNVRLFTGADGVINIQGIDIDATLTMKLPSAKSDGGEVNVLIDYGFLNSTVPNITAAEATLSVTSESEAVISAGRFRARAATWPTKEFVELPVVQGIASFVDEQSLSPSGYTLGLPGLKEQIDLVSFATPVKEGKHVVVSALIESTADILKVVATNGYVLAMSSMPGNLGEFKFVIPKPALELVSKLEGAIVKISDNDGSFFFQTETELATYNKTHGEFPNLKSILAGVTGYPTSVTIASKEEFIPFLKRQEGVLKSYLKGKDELPGIDIVYDGTTNFSITAVKEEKLASGNTFMDMSTDSVDVTGEGSPASTRLDILKILPFCEHATFPVTVKLNKRENIVDMYGNGGSYRYLVMPMQWIGAASSTSIPLPKNK